MHLLEKIQKKLKESQEAKKYIRKTFEYNVSDYQDDPLSILIDIENYLNNHSDKIEDFQFSSYVDSETFKTVLVLRLYPKDVIAKHILEDDNIERLASYNVKPLVVKSVIQEVLQSFVFENNDESTRAEMSNMLCSVIKSLIPDSETPDIRIGFNDNYINVSIYEDDKLLTLDQYLNKLK